MLELKNHGPNNTRVIMEFPRNAAHNKQEEKRDATAKNVLHSINRKSEKGQVYSMKEIP